MASFTFEISKDFLATLGRLGDVEQYAPKMLDEAAPILETAVKASIRSSTGSEATGELLASIKKSKVTKNKWGYYLQVRPTGKSARKGGGYLRKGKRVGRKKVEGGVRDPIRNMEKAVYLQYGTSKQRPRPWLEKALGDAEPGVLRKMQEVFEREVKG